jgi:hypothetical protein
MHDRDAAYDAVDLRLPGDLHARSEHGEQGRAATTMLPEPAPPQLS